MTRRAEPPEARAPVRRRCQVLLGAVAVLFFLAAVTLVDVTRFPVFDEAIYLSEVQKGAEGISFAAHRARGITWLIAPVAGLGASITAVRLWLAVLSSVGLWLAFRPWVASLGPAAPVAAALCVSGWVVVLYATDVSPNLLAAFAAVAATGYAFRPVSPRGKNQLIGVFTAMAVLALLRPTATAWLGLFLLLALPFRGRRGLAVLVSAGAGTALGWVPWIVEAYLRFGGPLERLEQMRSVTNAYGFQLLRYLRAADGPIPRGSWDVTQQGDMTQQAGSQVAPLVVAGAALLLALVIVGTVRPRSATSAAGVRAAAVAGLFLALPYLVLTDSVYVRFLLPSWALATLPLAEAVTASLARTGSRVVVVGALTIAALWAGAQLTTVRAVGAGVAATERELGLLARDVAPLVERPCFLLAEGGYAQLGYGAGCRTDWYQPDRDPPFRAPPERRAVDGRTVYALARTPHPVLEDWPSRPVAGHPDWRLYVMPGQSAS